jgi:YebC/PmpR family DNA-binding regulatory protein
MGAQWKQKGREISALKRGQLFGKLMKEIVVAVKAGGPDPDLNARLHAALETARKHSVPRDTIERAVKKGAGQTGETIAYELITYEGFAPGKVPIIVECLTDNRNRTAPGIRALFKSGQFGSPGSVAWMFEHVGLVEAHHPTAGQDLEAVAIEAGAQNVEPLVSDDVPADHAGARFYCDRADVNGVSQSLKKAGWTVTVAEMSYVAKNAVEPPAAQRAEIEAFLTAIDEHDDVHRVYTAMK